MYNKLRLTKELYENPDGFNSALMDIDPQHEYFGTVLAELDPYERQLKRFHIDIQSGIIKDFFQTSDSAVLFPEFVRRAVYKGLHEGFDKQGEELSEVILKTQISSLDYRGIHYEDNNIILNEELTHIYKIGRRLVCSYEAIKFQRLDLFTLMLKQIGKAIATSTIEKFNNLDTIKQYHEHPGCYSSTPKYQMVYTPIKVDYEKLINRNFEDVVISQYVGFNLLYWE